MKKTKEIVAIVFDKYKLPVEDGDRLIAGLPNDLPGHKKNILEEICGMVLDNFKEMLNIRKPRYLETVTPIIKDYERQIKNVCDTIRNQHGCDLHYVEGSFEKVLLDFFLRPEVVKDEN